MTNALTQIRGAALLHDRKRELIKRCSRDRITALSRVWATHRLLDTSVVSAGKRSGKASSENAVRPRASDSCRDWKTEVR